MLRIIMVNLTLAAATFGASSAWAQDLATARVSGTDGSEMGEVTLADTSSGLVHVALDLQGIPAGVHGVHLHETGDCSASDFASAGGHISGEADHGVLAGNGPHPGDLPNITVPDSGEVTVEYFVEGLSLAEMILDEDGAAFVVHSGADDYSSQPSGESGDRIACGVFGGDV